MRPFKNFFFLGTVFLLVVVIGCGGKENATTKQVSTASTANTVKGEFASSQFDEPGNCAKCHTQFYNEWVGSMHNNALKDPIYKRLVALGSKETKGETDVYCSKCHGPIAVLSGEIPPVSAQNASEIAMNGVQCDFCHTVTKGTIGNGGFSNLPGNSKTGPLKDAKPMNHEKHYSELHTKSEFCGMCHNVNNPGNKLPLEATYTEWEEGPYAKEGVQCQDCHMTPGPGVTKPNPGRLTDFSEERNQIYTHSIMGGNFAVTGLLGSTQHQNMAQERLKAAAKVEILKKSFHKTSDGAEFKIKVSNIGAGHYLPTGLTETREMWLDVIVTDENGNVVWESGALDGSGEIEKGAIVYNSVIADKNGKPTDKVWEASKILSDHRIPPKSSITEDVKITLDALPEQMNITAKLMYRSAPQRVINALFEKETFNVPVLVMTQDSKQFK